MWSNRLLISERDTTIISLQLINIADGKLKLMPHVMEDVLLKRIVGPVVLCNWSAHPWVCLVLYFGGVWC